MIESFSLEDLERAHGWRALAAKLRPFVARRVPDRDVDDVVQEVFVRIQRGLPKLKDDQRLGPWVYQVARNTIIDHLRAGRRRPPTADALVDVPDDRDDDDERRAEEDVAAFAGLFVAMLPSPYREALTLTELEGLTQREAAQMLGVSVSGMKSRVQRGRRKLRAVLEACCDIALDARQRVIGYKVREGGTGPDGCCS